MCCLLPTHVIMKHVVYLGDARGTAREGQHRFVLWVEWLVGEVIDAMLCRDLTASRGHSVSRSYIWTMLSISSRHRDVLEVLKVVVCRALADGVDVSRINARRCSRLERRVLQLMVRDQVVGLSGPYTHTRTHCASSVSFRVQWPPLLVRLVLAHLGLRKLQRQLVREQHGRRRRAHGTQRCQRCPRCTQ